MECKRVKFEEYQNEITNIRQQVFINEQKCPENMEWDENEEKYSIYFIGLKDSNVVGCIRLRDVGPNLLKLERVAVLKPYRRQRIATELIREAMIYTQTTSPDTSIYAYAQVSAIQVYVSLGFAVVSNVWIEEGTFIPHLTIFWSNPQSIRIFLNNQNEIEKNEKMNEYDVHHPKVIEKINKIKERIENFEYVNILSFNTLINDKILTKILRNRFTNLCHLIYIWLKMDPLKIEDQVCQNVAVEVKDIEKMEKLLIFIKKIADQKLNTGHFNEVDEAWRILYGLISFLHSFVYFKTRQFEKAIIEADKGLCMGRVDENIVPLKKLAWKVHRNLEKPSSKIIHQMYSENSPIKSLKPLHNSKNIREVNENFSSFELLISAVEQEFPIIVRNFAKNMDAFKKWNFKYLLEQLHSRTFPVEIGSKYSDDDWSQKMLSFKDFLQNDKNELMYLAQHRLFEQVPHLKDDLIIPDICFCHSDDYNNVDLNMWIGPSSTISPLHTDPRNNLFVQFNGSKLFRMISPKYSENVYPFDGMLSNTSQVDVEDPNLLEFPKFENVEVLDGIVNAGDALFIPRKWWHYVRSISPSISVSFWFD